MNGAWAYNDEQAVRVAGDDFGGFDAAADNGFDGILGKRNLGGEELRRNERVLAEDWVVSRAQLPAGTGWLPRVSSAARGATSTPGIVTAVMEEAGCVGVDQSDAF